MNSLSILAALRKTFQPAHIKPFDRHPTECTQICHTCWQFLIWKRFQCICYKRSDDDEDDDDEDDDDDDDVDYLLNQQQLEKNIMEIWRPITWDSIITKANYNVGGNGREKVFALDL